MTVTLKLNDTKQAFGSLWLLPSGLKGNETKDNKNGTSPLGSYKTIICTMYTNIQLQQRNYEGITKIQCLKET